MKKNYYEILEVDKNASLEIIKKAYSTLAKKYHPDLQPEDNKDKAEEKLKLINEAYETLSDEEKRKQYDLTIQSNMVSFEQYNAIYLENQELRNIINEMHKKYLRNRYIISDNNNTYNNSYNNNISTNNNIRNNYYSSEKNINNNTTNNIKNNKFFNKFKNLFSLILALIITYLLLKIPFIHNLIFSNLLK